MTVGLGAGLDGLSVSVVPQSTPSELCSPADPLLGRSRAKARGAHRWRLLRSMAAAVAAFGVAGCSGGPDQTVPPPEHVTTTSAAPTTTTAKPTTTTTEDPNLAEIMVAYEGTLTYLVTYGISTENAVIGDFAAEPVVSYMDQIIKGWAAMGYKIGPSESDIHILSVDIDGDMAVIASCNLDAITLLSESGAEVIPADTERYLRTTELQRLEQGWRVVASGLDGEEKTPCDI